MNEALKTILLQTKKDIFLNNFALLESKLGGDGLEFFDIKEYESSDAITHLNATATAKTRRPHVNIFTKELDIKVTLIVLVSASMFYQNKLLKLQELVGALSFVAINTKNSLEILFFSNKIERFFKATKSSYAIARAFRAVQEIDYSYKKVDFLALKNFLMEQKKGSKVFLLGDFLEFASLSPAHIKHDLSAFVIRDRTEEELSFLGEYTIASLEEKQTLTTTIDKTLQKRYQKAFREYEKKLFEEFKAMQLPFVKLYEDESVTQKIKELLWKI